MPSIENKIIRRDNLLSIEKLFFEEIIEEFKIILGWELYFKGLWVSLIDNKFT